MYLEMPQACGDLLTYVSPPRASCQGLLPGPPLIVLCLIAKLGHALARSKYIRFSVSIVQVCTRSSSNDYSVLLLLFSASSPLFTRYLDDDGSSIEPATFAPIAPLLLFNGAGGIGTGWSCSVPSYHPVQVVDNLLSMIDGGPVQSLMPWSKGEAATRYILYTVFTYLTIGPISYIAIKNILC